MTNLHSITQHTTDRLQFALTSGQFERDLLPAGEKLLAHLRRPTQITIMGPKGAGKSSLIRMILGVQDLELPTGIAISEVIFGPCPRVTFESADGSVTCHAGTLESQSTPKGTLRIVQEIPLAQLEGKSLVEINLPSRPDQKKIILDWAVETTNIVVWCTQNFDTHEATLWENVPDRLKDHSMLALTKADRLQMQGALKVQSARFEEELAEEFLGMFPVATQQAITARNGEEVTKAELWTNSGGAALMAGLTRLIKSGKTADLDQADILLARAVSVESCAKITNASGAPESANQAKNPAPKVHAPLPKGEMIESALACLDAHAKQMCGASADSPIAAKETLEKSLRAIQELNTILTSTDDPAMTPLKEEASESEQLILLLQLENTDAAACDALTTLLQLKKDLSQEAMA